MKVSELIDRLGEFDSNAEVYLQCDSRSFASPAWVGIMNTAGLFEEEEDLRLVISPWEPEVSIAGLRVRNSGRGGRFRLNL